MAIWATCLAIPITARADDDLFETFEVDAGAAVHQTVLTGFFTAGSVADLVVVSVEDDDRRSLRMFSLSEGRWQVAADSQLRPEVDFVDVIRIGGSDRLVTYEQGRLSSYDLATATEQPLAEPAGDYRSPDEGGVPRVEIGRDLNRDGREDLVMPDVDGFWISIQRRDGTFSKARLVGPPEPFAEAPVGNLDVGEPPTGPRTWGDVGITAATIPVYLSRLHALDFDLDERQDLVFWNRDHFEIHSQRPDGLFERRAWASATEIAIDSDGVYTRAFDFQDQGLWSTVFGLADKSERTVLHSFADLNGDGLADLITLTLSGRSIARQRSLYSVHFGKPTDEGLAFTREPDVQIRARGRAGAMQPWGYAAQRFADFDGDGRLDILLQDVSVGFGGMMRAMAGKSVPIDLELYGSTHETYPTKPNARHKIRRFAPFAGSGVFFPVVLTGDVNGDQRADVLIGSTPDKLQVFLGVAGTELISRRPR